MKIKSIKVIEGKNKWSDTKDKLIHMVLDLGEYEQKPSNKIEGFYERIKEHLPSLKSHRCSEGKPGGFLKRIKEGTWMGHIIEHIALELQTLAGYDTGWGRTRGVKGQKGVYNVIFNYEDEECGKLAAREAYNVVNNIINDRNPQIDRIVKKLKPKNLQENIRRILREEGFIPLPIRRRISTDDLEEAFDYALETMTTYIDNPNSILYKEKKPSLWVFSKFVIDYTVTLIEQEYFTNDNRIYFSDTDEDDETYHEKIRQPLLRHYGKRIKEKYDEVMSSNDEEIIQESIRRILREETNSDDVKSRQEEAAELIKRYGHYSSPDLRYITRPLYAYIEYENFGRLKELGVKYRFTPISEINLNGALSRFIKERGVFNGIGGSIIRLYNDEPVTKSDISRIKRKIQNIIDEFNTKLRTNYQIDGVVGEKSSDTLRNQLNQKLTDSEFNMEPTYNNIGIKISRGFEDEYLATIPMDEIDKPQMLD